MLTSCMNARAQPSDETSPLARLLLLRRDERSSVLLGASLSFCLLCAIMLLKPIRDELGVLGGARNLKYLWTATLAGTLVSSVVFSWLASRVGRRTFLTWSWRGVALLWLSFMPLLAWLDGPAAVHVARAFYVVHAVTNVFIVSLFWGLAADLFAPLQSRRLFGLLAIGATLGAIVGPAVTAQAARFVAPFWLIAPAALLLELAARCALAQARAVSLGDDPQARAPLGGDAFEGMRIVLRSPYLSGIAAVTFVLGVVQSYFTLHQNYAIESAIPDRAARTEYYGWLESASQLLTLVVQLFLARAVRRLGVGGLLLVLPVVALVGVGAMAIGAVSERVSLGVATACYVAWRGLSHSTQRPARELLYTPVSRVEKYKAKSFADTFAFRAGDLMSAYGFDKVSLLAAGLLSVPLTLGWGFVAVRLARRQQELVERSAPAD